MGNQNQDPSILFQHFELPAPLVPPDAVGYLEAKADEARLRVVEIDQAQASPHLHAHNPGPETKAIDREIAEHYDSVVLELGEKVMDDAALTTALARRGIQHYGSPVRCRNELKRLQTLRDAACSGDPRLREGVIRAVDNELAQDIESERLAYNATLEKVKLMGPPEQDSAFQEALRSLEEANNDLEVLALVPPTEQNRLKVERAIEGAERRQQAAIAAGRNTPRGKANEATRRHLDQAKQYKMIRAQLRSHSE